MKLRNIFLYAAIALTGIGATAQERMLEIYQNDGTVLQYPVSQIDSIKFSTPTTPAPEDDRILVKAAGKTFTMGYSELLPDFKEGWREHEVSFTKDFYLDKYEVTNGQFAQFLNENGYIGIYDETGYYALMDNDPKGATIIYNKELKGVYWDADAKQWVVKEEFKNHPAIYISWYGANEYAKWVGGYLPTEAQWEYAYRAGTTTDFFFGDAVQVYDVNWGVFTYEGLHDYAIIQTNYDYVTWTGTDPGTEAVGSKLPNPWGFYDMGGNVAEWCADWYGDYPTGPVTDPTGPESGDSKVRRGGAWFFKGQTCLSGFRSYDTPNYSNATYGFRVAYDVE